MSALDCNRRGDTAASTQFKDAVELVDLLVSEHTVQSVLITTAYGDPALITCFWEHYCRRLYSSDRPAFAKPEAGDVRPREEP